MQYILQLIFLSKELANYLIQMLCCFKPALNHHRKASEAPQEAKNFIGLGW